MALIFAIYFIWYCFGFTILAGEGKGVSKASTWFSLLARTAQDKEPMWLLPVPKYG